MRWSSRLLPPTLTLFVWLALWGEVTWANLASGVLVVGLIGAVIRPVPRSHEISPLKLMELMGVFVLRLVSSSLTVVRTVLAPTPERLRSGVVAVQLSHRSRLVATIVADAISLTPGTLTIDAQGVRDVERGGSDDSGEEARAAAGGPGPPMLYVHVLGLADPEEVRADVRSLEALVLAAVTPVEVVVP